MKIWELSVSAEMSKTKLLPSAYLRLIKTGVVFTWQAEEMVWWEVYVKLQAGPFQNCTFEPCVYDSNMPMKCHVDQWIPEVTSNMSSMVSPPYINGLILSLTQADWNFGRVYGNVRYLGTNSKSFSDCSCERSLTYLLQFS